MQALFKDVKHALRMFRESPGFTATAVAALTLGIGVNTAVFSVVNAVLLKPVPFAEPDRLVSLMNSQNGVPVNPAASPAKFIHYRAQTDVLEEVAAFTNSALNYTGGDTPERVTASRVSAAYFRVFRAPMALGRGFTAEEDLPGATRAVVISYDFWQRRLAGDPGALGRTLRLSGDEYTIVGVVGRDFDMREFGDPEVWVPFQLDPNTTDQGHYFQVAGRLLPGVSLEQARARLEASAAAYRERFPNALQPNAGFSAATMQEAIVGPFVRTALYVLLGAVGFVLLIACANVANLLLLRATARRREIAIRSALGAGRWRLVRQLLTESLMLSLAGGALGLVLGYVGMRALLTVNTAGLPRLGSAGSLMGLDWRVVTFTLGLSLATGLVFGLVPALAASQTDLNAVIKDSNSRAGSGFRQNKTRSVFVTVEVALAVVLLIGATLLIRTSVALNRVDPGFVSANVLTMRTSMTEPRFRATAAVEATARTALDRLRLMPGVAAATATCCVPLQGGYGLPFNIVGRANEGPFTGGGSFVTTSSGYFEAFGIPVLRGRAFNDRDDAAAPPVALINEALAEQFWDEGADPLQDRILIGGGAANMKELAVEPERQIVGIVGNIRANGLQNDPGPTMYVPQAQMPDALNALNVQITPMAWVVRTEGDPTALSSSIQEALRQATGLPVTQVQTMAEVVAIAKSRQHLNTLLMSTFGAAALVLAAIGIYGLMAYAAEQRTQEIGIRLALGADGARVRNMVVRQGMVLVAIGLVVGLLGAYFMAALLGSFLFGVAAHDIAAFAGVPAVLVGVALVAVWAPARRASRVDPLDALRYE